MDFPKNWKCAENAWQKAGAVGLCGLDVVGFIPGAGTAAKGAKGVSMAGKGAKLGKVANKADNVIDATVIEARGRFLNNNTNRILRDGTTGRPIMNSYEDYNVRKVNPVNQKNGYSSGSNGGQNRNNTRRTYNPPEKSLQEKLAEIDKGKTLERSNIINMQDFRK